MAPLDVSAGPSYGTVDQTEQHNDEEMENLLLHDSEAEGEFPPSEVASTTTDEVQEGVRKIEAINLTWTTRSLIIAYVRCVYIKPRLIVAD